MKSKKKNNVKRKKRVRKNKAITGTNSPYSVTNSGGFRQLKPVIKNTKKGIVVTHSEFLGDLVIPAGDESALITHSMEPASAAFLALSEIAKLYEKYRWLKLKFHWIPTLPNTADGQVIMTFDYDIMDNDSPSKVEMLTMEGSKVGKITMPQQIIMKPQKHKLFTLYGAQPTDTDLKTYVYSRLLVKAYNTDTSVDRYAGSMVVEYSVQLAHFQPMPVEGIQYIAGNTQTANEWFWSMDNLCGPDIVEPTNVIDSSGYLDGLRFKRPFYGMVNFNVDSSARIPDVGLVGEGTISKGKYNAADGQAGSEDVLSILLELAVSAGDILFFHDDIGTLTDTHRARLLFLAVTKALFYYFLPQGNDYNPYTVGGNFKLLMSKRKKGYDLGEQAVSIYKKFLVNKGRPTVSLPIAKPSKLDKLRKSPES
jgi:hypothetical protein